MWHKNPDANISMVTSDPLISTSHSLVCKRSVDAFRAATSEHYFKTNVPFKNMQNQLEILRLPEAGLLFKC